MEIPGSLQTISEIGVAIAGFSGLIVAFRRNTGPLTYVEKYRLKVLLNLALGAMFLAFVPEIAHQLGVSPRRLWRLSGGVLAIYSIVFIVWWLVASRRLMRLVPEIFHWSAFSRMAAGHVIVILLQLGVTFALLDGYATGIYLLGLVWYLMHAAQQFTRMLFIQPKTGAAGDT